MKTTLNFVNLALIFVLVGAAITVQASGAATPDPAVMANLP